MADKWGDTDFDRVPSGPLKGRPWRDVPALTLHGLLLAVDFGIADDLDERRVWAIHEGLRAKDDPRAQQLLLDLPNTGFSGASPSAGPTCSASESLR